MAWNPVNAVKSALRSRIRTIAQIVFLTPTTFKYVPAQSARDPLRITDIEEDLGRDENGLPIPPQTLWIGYGPTLERYLAARDEDVATMRALLKQSGYVVQPGDRVLDFGCGAGRMIRHFAAEASAAEFWGADISAEHILWANRHLRPPFRFVTTTTLPHLPFGDGYFQMIYAGSVFTHIADLADAWLLELRRVLAPGGRMYLTFHDSHTRTLLNTKYADVPLARLVKRRALFDGDFALLASDRWPEYGGTQVFYSDAHLRATLTSMFTICSMTREAYGYQTAVIVTRP